MIALELEMRSNRVMSDTSGLPLAHATYQANDKSIWNRAAALEYSSEAEVEQWLILPLLSALGYADIEITPKAPITFQHGRAGRKHEADYLVHEGSILSDQTSLMVVEAKRPNEDLDAAKLQAQSYASATCAPFLLVTDGLTLQIWQMQVSQSSECVFSCQVRDLAQSRGKIEQIIGRSAALWHAQSLGYKSVVENSLDISPYLAAELKRLGPVEVIERRLLHLANKQEISASQLTSLEALKIFVGGPSGYGKSALGKSVFVSALSTLSASAPVPFLISLADLAFLRTDPETFAHERIAAHCPHLSLHAFRDLLVSRGALFVFDGLDRIDHDAQRTFLANIGSLLRDRPKVQVVVLGRIPVPNEIGLVEYELQPLNYHERAALAEMVGSRAMELHRLPKVLEPLLESPLLLTLILQHVKVEGAPPDRLDSLFSTWLNEMLTGCGTPSTTARLQSLLCRIAVLIANGRLSRTTLLKSMKEEGEADHLLDLLIGSGAIISENQIEICHDAMADYLRAVALLDAPQSQRAATLTSSGFAAGSFLAPLLISMCDDVVTQDAIWRRLNEAGVDRYLDTLHYIPPVKFSLPVSDADSAAFVDQFRRGIVEPAKSYFPEIEAEIVAALVWEPAPDIEVKGRVNEGGTNFSYSFSPSHKPSRQPAGFGPGGGFSLTVGGGRGDPRREGTRLLLDALETVIANRRLKAGVNWTNDRLAGRIRFLNRKHRAGININAALSQIEQDLLRSSGHVYLDNPSRSFAVTDMVDDVRWLMGRDQQELDLWWDREHADPNEETSRPDEVKLLINEYWRRSQIIYAELVEHSFSSIRTELQFYAAMPVRYNVQIYSVPDYGPGMQSIWFPVEHWAQSGADIEHSTEFNSLYDDGVYERVMAELARLGRGGCRSMSYVQGSVPRFDGSRRFGSFDGETAAIRTALSFLASDLDRLFRHAPGGGFNERRIV